MIAAPSGGGNNHAHKSPPALPTHHSSSGGGKKHNPPPAARHPAPAAPRPAPVRGNSVMAAQTAANNAALAAENRAVARANADKRNAGSRYATQAGNLEQQARALQHALNVDFGNARDIKLANVGRVLADQQANLLEGYRQRLGALQGASDDNDASAADQTVANRANLLRERQDAVSEAMSQGAGETDTLQSQLMSLRNWNSNQSDVHRSYFDTQRSVNSSLTDLNVDTKNGMLNNETQANADKDQIWTNYFNQRSQTYTQLGNVRGQQADYMASAHEMDAHQGNGAGYKNQAGAAFMDAAQESGKAWKNPGNSDALMKWQGHAPLEGHGLSQAPAQAQVDHSPTVGVHERPEGATLRKW